MQRAFSLVELSIVLVILGLLTGGILAGQSLIRASELRAISTEYGQWVTATLSFRDKYFALPGDMANAGKVWGMANTAGTNGECAAPASNTGTGTQTCNGDGDGQVGDSAYEMFRYWQHLANAGLVEGSFTGIAGLGGVANAVLRQNVPASKLSNSGWSVFYSGNYTTSGQSWVQGIYDNYLIVGTSDPIIYTLRPAFKPEEVWNIDTKMDDGMAGTGKIVPYPYASGSTSSCSTITAAASNGDTSGAYALTSNRVLCSIAFRRAF